MEGVRQRRRRGQATRGLDDHLHALGEEAHGLDQHGVGHGHDVGDQGLDDREVGVADVGDDRSVGDRMRRGDVDHPARAQRLAAIVARLGFDPDDFAAR